MKIRLKNFPNGRSFVGSSPFSISKRVYDKKVYAHIFWQYFLICHCSCVYFPLVSVTLCINGPFPFRFNLFFFALTLFWPNISHSSRSSFNVIIILIIVMIAIIMIESPLHSFFLLLRCTVLCSLRSSASHFSLLVLHLSFFCWGMSVCVCV